MASAQVVETSVVNKSFAGLQSPNLGMLLLGLNHFLNKSFIDQASSVKTTGLASFSFCVFTNLDSASVHKNAKRELGQYPAILTSRLVDDMYIYTVVVIQKQLS